VNIMPNDITECLFCNFKDIEDYYSNYQDFPIVKYHYVCKRCGNVWVQGEIYQFRLGDFHELFSIKQGLSQEYKNPKCGQK